MNITDITRAALAVFARGGSVRRYPGGSRVLLHRWPASRMRGVRSYGDLLIGRSNGLLKRLRGNSGAQ